MVATGIFENSVLDISWDSSGYVMVACSSDGTVTSFVFNRSELGIALSAEERKKFLQNVFASVRLPSSMEVAETPDLLQLENQARHETSQIDGPDLRDENQDVSSKTTQSPNSKSHGASTTERNVATPASSSGTPTKNASTDKNSIRDASSTTVTSESPLKRACPDSAGGVAPLRGNFAGGAPVVEEDVIDLGVLGGRTGKRSVPAAMLTPEACDSRASISSQVELRDNAGRRRIVPQPVGGDSEVMDLGVISSSKLSQKRKRSEEATKSVDKPGRLLGENGVTGDSVSVSSELPPRKISRNVDGQSPTTVYVETTVRRVREVFSPLTRSAAPKFVYGGGSSRSTMVECFWEKSSFLPGREKVATRIKGWSGRTTKFECYIDGKVVGTYCHVDQDVCKFMVAVTDDARMYFLDSCGRLRHPAIVTDGLIACIGGNQSHVIIITVSGRFCIWDVPRRVCLLSTSLSPHRSDSAIDVLRVGEFPNGFPFIFLGSGVFYFYNKDLSSWVHYDESEHVLSSFFSLHPLTIGPAEKQIFSRPVAWMRARSVYRFADVARQSLLKNTPSTPASGALSNSARRSGVNLDSLLTRHVSQADSRVQLLETLGHAEILFNISCVLGSSVEIKQWLRSYSERLAACVPVSSLETHTTSSSPPHCTREDPGWDSNVTEMTDLNARAESTLQKRSGETTKDDDDLFWLYSRVKDLCSMLLGPPWSEDKSDPQPIAESDVNSAPQSLLTASDVQSPQDEGPRWNPMLAGKKKRALLSEIVLPSICQNRALQRIVVDVKRQLDELERKDGQQISVDPNPQRSSKMSRTSVLDGL
eukprot:Rmarinus@m.4584